MINTLTGVYIEAFVAVHETAVCQNPNGSQFGILLVWNPALVHAWFSCLEESEQRTDLVFPYDIPIAQLSGNNQIENKLTLLDNN